MDAQKFADMIRDNTAIGFAALSSSLNILRILANRGLVSPGEVETIYTEVMEVVERYGSEGLQSNNAVNIGGIFVELRETAKKRWIGQGKTDPK